MMCFVVDTPFNRETCPSLIGQRLEQPPASAISVEVTAFENMTDSELVAYWNVLQMGGVKTHRMQTIRKFHSDVVHAILIERKIPHNKGEMIETVRVDRQVA